jgi:hypothetical protein
MTRQIRLVALVAALISSPAYAALVMQQGDSAVPAVYANGGGGGFGGTLGNGAITMDVVGTNLNIGFIPGNALNDVVALYLDTKSGGFVDADMRDHADGGRTALSELTLTQNDSFPLHVLPDFGVAIGNFGSVLFELNAGNTDGHLNFQIFNPAPTISIPLALLGNPAYVDFFAGYASGGGYNSNESLPYSAPLQASGNPGFGDGQFGGLFTGGTYENFNRFITTAVPEASTIFVWSLVFMSAACVRCRFNKTTDSERRAG